MIFFIKFIISLILLKCYAFFEKGSVNFKMNENYRYKTTPIASENAVIKGNKYRFTILTSQLLRIEYSENGCFEDRATQAVINRCFEVPEFNVSEKNELLTITTEHIELTYNKEKPFLPTTLKLCYRGKNSNVMAGGNSTVWSFGTAIKNSLKGTARTLDDVNGACDLEDGIMSQGAVTVFDDSNSLIICEDGNTTAYKSGRKAITKMELDWNKKPVFTIDAPKGDLAIIPESRRYEIEFIGIDSCEDITVTENGAEKKCEIFYKDGILTVVADNVCGTLSVQFNSAVKMSENKVWDELCDIIEKLENVPNTMKDHIYDIIKRTPSSAELVSELVQLGLDEKVLLALCEVINA